MTNEVLLAALLRSIPDLVFLKSPEGLILACNPRFEAVFGLPPGDIIGRSDYELLPADLAESIRTQDRQVLEAGQPRRHADWVTFADGHRELLETHKTPMFDADGTLIGVLGVARDITETKRAQVMLELANGALDLIARGAPLEQTLRHVVAELELQHPEMLCSILLLDDAGAHLHHCVAPSLPEAYCRVIEGVAIGPRVGSCGTAAYSRQAVFVSDIASDPLWADFAALALAHELRACWSTPLFASDGGVLGTFAAYYRTPRSASELERSQIASVSHLMAIAIERHQEAARRSTGVAELRRWYEATLGRETRVLELKEEVNALLARLGEQARYACASPPEPDHGD